MPADAYDGTGGDVSNMADAYAAAVDTGIDDVLQEQDDVADRDWTLHANGGETRSGMVYTILGHPQGLPTRPELADAVDRNESCIENHVPILTDYGLVEQVELPEEERSNDQPYVFYGLTDSGWDVLQAHTDIDDHTVAQARADYQAHIDQRERPLGLLERKAARYADATRPDYEPPFPQPDHVPVSTEMDDSIDDTDDSGLMTTVRNYLPLD